MAEYASYASASSDNQQNKTTSIAGAKRPALAVLNHNQVFQPNYGKISERFKNDCDNACPVIQSTRFFEIFEDSGMDTKEEVVIKSPIIPDCVRRLLTLEDNIKSFSIESSKENESCYFEFPEDPSVDERRKDELNWTCPYKHDIYHYLSNLEMKYRPRPNYMKKQPDITMNMRTVLVDWLIEVGEEYKLLSETVHLAVAYVDRFLSQMSVLRAKLQLVGTACLFIASKYEEIYPPELKDFVYITDDTYTKKQILRMEQLVLSVLNFDIATPTAFSFLQLYGSIASLPEKIVFLAQYICEITLLEAEPFLLFVPSEIAAASLILANYTLGNSLLWPDELKTTTGKDVEQVWTIVECLFEKYSIIHTYAQQAVCDKYKSPKYQCVSEIPCLEKLTT